MWKRFPHYWSLVRGIHRSPVDSFIYSHQNGALMFAFLAWTSCWTNSRVDIDLRHHATHIMSVQCILYQYFDSLLQKKWILVYHELSYYSFALTCWFTCCEILVKFWHDVMSWKRCAEHLSADLQMDTQCVHKSLYSIILFHTSSSEFGTWLSNYIYN